MLQHSDGSAPSQVTALPPYLQLIQKMRSRALQSAANLDQAGFIVI